MDMLTLTSFIPSIPKLTVTPERSRRANFILNIEDSFEVILERMYRIEKAIAALNATIPKSGFL
jgi:hypothetical protein